MKDERIEVIKNWPEQKFVHDIQVFLNFVNFYWRFIQGFNKIAGPLISMLQTLSSIGLSTILQLIDVADKNEVGDSKSSDNKINLLNSSTSKRSTGAGYLTSGGAKRGGGNNKKGVKAARDPNYLNPATKKAFNYLRHTFIQAPILQNFDSE